jgi:hypothetical protein
MVTVVFEVEELEEHVINSMVCVTQGLLPTEVLPDNQANISIVHPLLLTNIRKGKQNINVKGVGGTQLIVDMVGDLEGFLRCMPASIQRQTFRVLQT